MLFVLKALEPVIEDQHPSRIVVASGRTVSEAPRRGEPA
jgi:hypothetical protein